MNIQFEMWRKIKIICLVIVGIFFWALCGNLSAEEEVVKVETFISKDGIHPGETFKVAFLVKISQNWHINAHELADEFLFPTSLTVEEDKSIKAMKYYYPEPKSGKFDYSESELLVYDGGVILGALVKIGDDVELGEQKLKAKFKYQACDNTSCLPPKTLNFEITFLVVNPSQETKKIHQEIFSKLDFEKDNTSL